MSDLPNGDGVIDGHSQMPDWLINAHNDHPDNKPILKEYLSRVYGCIEELFTDERKWSKTKGISLFLLGALWIKCSQKYSR